VHDGIYILLWFSWSVFRNENETRAQSPVTPRTSLQYRVSSGLAAEKTVKCAVKYSVCSRMLLAVDDRMWRLIPRRGGRGPRLAVRDPTRATECLAVIGCAIFQVGPDHAVLTALEYASTTDPQRGSVTTICCVLATAYLRVVITGGEPNETR